MIANSKKIFISLLLLFFGSILLVFLLTHNIADTSINSTSLYTQISVLNSYRNYTVDIIKQIFGISAYIIPILMFSWSFKLFHSTNISHVRIRLITLVYCLTTLPVIIHINYSEYQSGLIGSYLALQIPIFYNFNIIFILLTIIATLFALNISTKDILGFSKFLGFVGIIISRILNYIAKKTFKNLYDKIKNKYYQSKKEYEIKQNYIQATDKDIELEDTTNNNSLLINQKNDYDEQNTETESFENLSFNTESFEIKPPEMEEIQESKDIKQFSYTSNKIDDNEEENHVINTVVENKITQSEQEKYNLPASLFAKSQEINNQIINDEIKANARKIEQIVKEFSIEGKVVNIKTGPVITLYEMIIPAGVKTSKLTALETDLALRMRAISVRIAVVPGKDVVGIEIPNPKRQIVYLRKLLETQEFIENDYELPIILGEDINGSPIVTDLSKMPHLLIAGTTGSGKSVGVNAMILSLLYKFSPDQCKMIMIDPKMLELSVYQDIPHLLTPVVIDSKKAVAILKWVVKEMEERYYKMSLLEVRNIIGYNQKRNNKEFMLSKKEEIMARDNIDINFEYMPYIVVVIDEMADLMLVAGKEVEIAVQRLAQMARAAGIHVIMATQRPSADVITGTIKANFPSRISFQVSSKIDSRVILGEQGAEKLLGKGDMLFMEGVGRIKRVHGPFVSDGEVSEVSRYLKKISKPNYLESLNTSVNQNTLDEETNELLEKAIEIIRQEGKVSTSFLQRKLQIGYNKAASLVEEMEEKGLISKPQGAGKRDIYI